MKLNPLLLGIVIFLFVCLGLTSMKSREGITYGTPITFNYTGSTQYWTCPDGVSKIEVEMWAGQGGGYGNAVYVKMWGGGHHGGGDGGKGGYGKFEMPTTSGFRYPIFVGGEGRALVTHLWGRSSGYGYNSGREHDRFMQSKPDNRGGWPNGGAASGNPGNPGNSSGGFEGAGSGGGSTSIHNPGHDYKSGVIAVVGGGGGGYGGAPTVGFAYGRQGNAGGGLNQTAGGSHGGGLGGVMQGGHGTTCSCCDDSGGGGGGWRGGNAGACNNTGGGGSGMLVGGTVKISTSTNGANEGNGKLILRPIITHKKLSTAYCMPMSSDGLSNPLYQGKWSANKERTSSSSGTRRCANPRGFEIGGGISSGAEGGDNCITSNIRAGCLSACKSAGVSNCSSPELPQIQKCTPGQTVQGEQGGNSWSTCNKCITEYDRSSDKRKCTAVPVKNCANQPNNGLICTRCDEGYRLVDNKCLVMDITNCADQGSPKGPKCLSCGAGYQLSDNKRSCTLRPIEECKTQDGITCKECNMGYEYDKPPPTQNRCLITPIKYCVDQRKIFCHQCQTKWIPSEDRRTCKAILPIKWCQVQRGKICETCVKGYTVSSGGAGCTKNSKPEKAVPGKSGDRGGIGPVGAKGVQGLIGPEGRPAGIGDLGWRGSTGEQGDVGPDGPEGNIGSTGAVGHKGAIGLQGPTTVIDPWANKAIVNSLKSIYKKIQTKNQEYTGKKNPPINLNIKMGHLGDGEIKSVHRSTETLGENIGMDIGDLNPAKDKSDDLSMLEGFNTYTYIR